MKPNLEAFAATQKHGMPCSICILPEAKEINGKYGKLDGRGKPIGATVIYNWLTRVQGRDVTLVAVQKHFYQGRHHEKKG